MTEAAPFLGRMIGKLEAAGVPYMVTGSLASSAFGEPRTSFDVDIVISPTLDQLRAFVGSLEEDLYVSIPAAEEAFQRRGMFNVLDPHGGLKADLIILKDRPFDVQEFGRRRTGRIQDVEVVLISPEDSILSKLEWSKRGGSERQLRDALGVAVVQGERLDLAYLRRWAVELGVEDLLEKVLDESARTR